MALTVFIFSPKNNTEYIITKTGAVYISITAVETLEAPIAA